MLVPNATDMLAGRDLRRDDMRRLDAALHPYETKPLDGGLIRRLIGSAARLASIVL